MIELRPSGSTLSRNALSVSVTKPIWAIRIARGIVVLSALITQQVIFLKLVYAADGKLMTIMRLLLIFYRMDGLLWFIPAGTMQHLNC